MYSIHRPGVLIRPKATTRKLSDVEQRAVPGIRLRRPVAQPPYVVATYVSIAATCPDSCTFKNNGCFAQSGFIKRFAAALDAQAAGLSGLDVARHEAEAIRGLFGGRQVPQDGARGGRDLRLHVGGDVASAEAAALLAAAAEDWKRRGGGAVWTYTHRWKEIPVDVWGPIAVWASTESRRAAEQARDLGYRVCITLPEHLLPGNKAFGLGELRVVPCPWETRQVTCTRCRLCLGENRLGTGTAIGFSIHGMGFEKREAEAAWANASVDL